MAVNGEVQSTLSFMTAIMSKSQMQDSTPAYLGFVNSFFYGSWVVVGLEFN